jgi:glycosyltransferase involved in cell wall biosynthesis
MNINFTFPITTQTSYGIVGTNIAKILSEKCKLSIFPIGSIDFHKEDETFIKKCLEHSNTFDYICPSIRLFHQFSLAHHVGRGLKIGWVIFELTKFNDVELHNLKSQDRLFVSSKWAKDIIEDNNILDFTKVHVVPLGTDREIFNENVKPIIPKNQATRFINIGKFEFRKNSLGVVDAFSKTFSAKDNVELLLCWSNPFLNQQEVDEYTKYVQNTPLSSKIKFIPRVNHPTQLAGIMASCDCLVAPSRTEGWNLPNLDSLSMGLHLITTNYSAHTEYCTKENSSLIEIEDLEVANDGKWFHGQGSWAKFGKSQFEQLVYAMRQIHDLKRSGNLAVNTAGISTSKNYTWNHTACKIVDVLENF